MLLNQVHAELQRINLKINVLKEQLNQYPQGHLKCICNGKYCKWFQIDKNMRRYLPKNQKMLAQQLADKTLLMAQLDDLEHNRSILEDYLNSCLSYSSKEKSLLNNPYFNELNTLTKPASENLFSWSKEKFPSLQNHPESLKFKCLSGIMVRSKSEVIIDQVLFSHKIPYRYECELKIGANSFYPDFTIRHPQTGDFFYWEHFGMMDDPIYIRKTLQKIEFYNSIGIIPGVKLIMTFETKEHPLDISLVESIVCHYFD